MPEYSEKGLTLRWDGADLVPSAGQSLGPRVVVAARPPHPSNAVTADLHRRRRRATRRARLSTAAFASLRR